MRPLAARQQGLRDLCCAWSFSRVRLFVNPMNCSSPGSSVHRIFQARTLERVAISSSPGSGRFLLLHPRQMVPRLSGPQEVGCRVRCFSPAELKSWIPEGDGGSYG